MAKKVAKQICVLCNEIVNANNNETIKHRNYYMDEKFCYCKRCVYRKQDENGDIKDTLRMLNIPFVEKLWVEINTKHGKEKALPNYLRAIAPNRNYITFLDSEYSTVSDSKSFVVTEKIINRWGIGYDNNRYEELEIKFNTLVKIKPPQTILEESLYRDNVLINQNLQEALRNGSSQDIERLTKLYTNNLKTLGLDVVKSNLSDIEALGLRIAKWESEEPIPEMSDEFKDVDKISRYISRFFQMPFKRAMGVATQEEIEMIYRDDLTQEEPEFGDSDSDIEDGEEYEY